MNYDGLIGKKGAAMAERTNQHPRKHSAVWESSLALPQNNKNPRSPSSTSMVFCCFVCSISRQSTFPSHCQCRCHLRERDRARAAGARPPPLSMSRMSLDDITPSMVVLPHAEMSEESSKAMTAAAACGSAILLS